MEEFRGKLPKDFKWPMWEDENRCSFCRDPIGDEDKIKIQVAPHRILNDKGELLELKWEGAKLRFLHLKCFQESTGQKVICEKCGRLTDLKGVLCTCRCHHGEKTCYIPWKDLERAPGKDIDR
jgi:hypothetical protein